MSKSIEEGRISTINLNVSFSEKEKKDLEKKVIEIREKLVNAQIENRRQLPFASPDTLKRTFNYWASLV